MFMKKEVISSFQPNIYVNIHKLMSLTKFVEKLYQKKLTKYISYMPTTGELWASSVSREMHDSNNIIISKELHSKTLIFKVNQRKRTDAYRINQVFKECLDFCRQTYSDPDCIIGCFSLTLFLYMYLSNIIFVHTRTPQLSICNSENRVKFLYTVVFPPTGKWFVYSLYLQHQVHASQKRKSNLVNIRVSTPCLS